LGDLSTFEGDRKGNVLSGSSEECQNGIDEHGMIVLSALQGKSIPVPAEYSESAGKRLSHAGRGHLPGLREFLTKHAEPGFHLQSHRIGEP
jgi:hypothetical protein